MGVVGFYEGVEELCHRWKYGNMKPKQTEKYLAFDSKKAHPSSRDSKVKK